MTQKFAMMFAALIVSSGASAGIEGTMASGVGGPELCVVENARVQPKFRDVMVRVLGARGYRAKLVETNVDCPVVMAFSAKYARSRMGTVSVLKTSRFTVYRDLQQIGDVTFRYSHGPLGNGTVEEVVTRMVERLLPARY
jgi:hypothetical protein